MRSRHLLSIAVLCAAVFAGCRGMLPNWFNPGTEQSQRSRAAVHDPYADPDLGPAVVGGRPRDFQKPAAEPVRNRALRDNWWQGYGQQ